MWTTRKSKKSNQSSLNITCSRWNIYCTVWFITHISTCESNDADKDRVAVLHQDLGSPTASHLINNLFLILSLKVLLKKNITGSWQSKLQRSYVSIRYLICFTGSPRGKKTRAGVIGGKVFHAEGGGLPGWIPANATSVVWCLFLSVSGRGESDATASLFDTALNPLCMKASDWYWNIHHTLVVPDHWSAEDAICMRWDHLGSHNLTTEHPRTYCWVFFYTSGSVSAPSGKFEKLLCTRAQRQTRRKSLLAELSRRIRAEDSSARCEHIAYQQLVWWISRRHAVRSERWP